MTDLALAPADTPAPTLRRRRRAPVRRRRWRGGSRSRAGFRHATYL